MPDGLGSSKRSDVRTQDIDRFGQPGSFHIQQQEHRCLLRPLHAKPHGPDAPERRPFFLYVDEFQTFTTLAFANMMPELRKYGVGLTLAHQYLHQLDDDVRHSVLGNTAMPGR